MAIEIPITSLPGMEDILKPSDRPVKGNQRLVPFFHIPKFGNFPVIWVSPYTVLEAVEKNGPLVQVVKCVVLTSKGPPKPDISIFSVRPEDLKLCHVGPVEW